MSEENDPIKELENVKEDEQMVSDEQPSDVSVIPREEKEPKELLEELKKQIVEELKSYQVNELYFKDPISKIVLQVKNGKCDIYADVDGKIIEIMKYADANPSLWRLFLVMLGHKLNEVKMKYLESKALRKKKFL